MKSVSNESSKQGFVRNEQLCGHYHSVGMALLAYEREAPLLLRAIDKPAMANLRVALSFIPDSILDSYLEDLLDLEIQDKDIFIASPAISVRMLLVGLPFAGLLGAAGTGFYLSTLDIAYSYCVAVIVFFSIPFALLWEWVPGTSNRRLFFARLIAAVISNRRGYKMIGSRKSRLGIKELVPSSQMPCSQVQPSPAQVVRT